MKFPLSIKALRIGGGLVSALLLCAVLGKAQEVSSNSAAPVPEVGRKIPDFRLDDITYFETRTASSKDFKGKWLVLDFWFTGCVTCIKSFPKVNTYQKMFANKIQWIMVGYVDGKANRNTKQFYEKLKIKQNLNLSIAYDSLLVNRWSIESMPHVIIVDPEGIVRVITTGQDLTKEKINDMLAGKDVVFDPKNVERKNFDVANQILSEGNPDNDEIVYLSALTKWSGENQSAGDINSFVLWRPEQLKKGFHAVMVPLYSLFNQAYFGQWTFGSPGDSLYGKIYPYPILQLRDSSLFKYDYHDPKGPGLYNFSLTVPVVKISRKYLMKLLGQELKSIFGYEVALETREMPVWRLVRAGTARSNIETKGGYPYLSPGIQATGFTARNISMNQFLRLIIRYISDYQPYFVDETGITTNVDVMMDADMTNFESVRGALRNLDLDIVHGLKSMKVLVIKDTGK